MDSGQAVAAFDVYLKVRRREVRELAVRLGLKEVQWMALRYLARCNGMSDQPSAVAAYLVTSPGTISQSLLALERKGLVSKTRDGRTVHVSVTDAGRELLAQGIGGVSLAHDDMSVDLDLFAALEAAYLARVGVPTFGGCATCVHEARLDETSHCMLADRVLKEHERTLRCRHHRDRRAEVMAPRGSGRPPIA